MLKSTSLSICLTTAGSLGEGEKLARRLVEKRLAACVNVLPGVISFYHWKQKICRDEEVLLVIKTLTPKLSLLETELKKIHPYEVPEFVVLSPSNVSKEYLKWIKEVVC